MRVCPNNTTKIIQISHFTANRVQQKCATQTLDERVSLSISDRKQASNGLGFVRRCTQMLRGERKVLGGLIDRVRIRSRMCCNHRLAPHHAKPSKSSASERLERCARSLRWGTGTKVQAAAGLKAAIADSPAEHEVGPEIHTSGRLSRYIRGKPQARCISSIHIPYHHDMRF